MFENWKNGKKNGKFYIQNDEKTCIWIMSRKLQYAVAGVVDEPYSPLTPLSGVAVWASQSTVHRLEPSCPS
jgi:hypothetical protein